MSKDDKKTSKTNEKITCGRTTPSPSNSLKPKIISKPKDKK